MLGDIDSNYSLYDLFKLLKEKYCDVAFKEVAKAVNNEIKIVISIHRYAKSNNAGESTLPLIEFLKSFNANVHEVNAEYFYISQCVITFHESKLKDVIAGLQDKPTIDNHNKKMVMK